MIGATSRSAFATMTAIILLGLVTVTLATLVAVSHGDHQRTESSLARAQRRQMFLAATIDANARASEWGESPPRQQWQLDLPANGSAIQMELVPGISNHLQVKIINAPGRLQELQSLKYVRTDSRWHLVELAGKSG